MLITWCVFRVTGLDSSDSSARLELPQGEHNRIALTINIDTETQSS